MADDSKRYPPSERRLSRLWRAGSTPASPALVGAAVIVATGLLVTLAAPVAAGWMSGWVHAALRAAGEPEAALAVAREIALLGGLLAAGVGIFALTAALVVQRMQVRGRAAGARLPPAGREYASLPRIDGRRLARALLLTGLAGVGVAAAVRGALIEVAASDELQGPAETLATVIGPIAWPLLLMLLGVAALDAIGERAAWLRDASMTRREVEEELREVEGHPLTRERRSVLARRRTDA